MTTPTTIDERKLTTREAAAALGIKEQTLHLWRCTRRYDLPYVQLGRSVRYLASDIEQFIARQRVGGEQ